MMLERGGTVVANDTSRSIGGRVRMGLIPTEVNLSNPRNSRLAPLTVRALVDTGAVNLCVPEHVAVQLELAELERREVTTADGKHALVPYVARCR